MANDTRPSLTTTLDQRYGNQRAGGAFEVKDVIGKPGTVPAAGTVYDAKSFNGQAFQTPNGFQFKMMPMTSQFIEVQTSGKNGGMSRYVQGLDTRKYKG